MRVLRYQPDKFFLTGHVTGQINKAIEEREFFAVASDSIQLDGMAFEAYWHLSESFDLPFAFYPYSEMILEANRIFGAPNPAISVKMADNIYVDIVRQLNVSCMFFNPKFIGNIRMCDSKIFMEKFINDLFNSKLLCSNTLFTDVHDSHTLFAKYRGGFSITYGNDYFAELKTQKFEYDHSTDKILNMIHNKKEKYASKEKSIHPFSD